MSSTKKTNYISLKILRIPESDIILKLSWENTEKTNEDDYKNRDNRYQHIPCHTRRVCCHQAMVVPSLSNCMFSCFSI